VFLLFGLSCVNIKTATGAHIFLTSRLRFDLVQPSFYRLLVDVAVSQYSRLQQRKVAFLEVDDNRAGDVSAFFGTHRHHRCQTPLQFTNKTPSLQLSSLADNILQTYMYVAWLSFGGTENAEPENAGENAGPENAGLENAGPGVC